MRLVSDNVLVLLTAGNLANADPSELQSATQRFAVLCLHIGSVVGDEDNLLLSSIAVTVFPTDTHRYSHVSANLSTPWPLSGPGKASQRWQHRAAKPQVPNRPRVHHAGLCTGS